MAGITVVGLGPGAPDSITREAWEILAGAPEIYLRTARHPLAERLAEVTVVHSFDSVYQSARTPEDVYRTIVETLLPLARVSAGVVYAVPGDPTFGEAAVSELRRRAQSESLPFRVVAGISFVEPTLALLGRDALEGWIVADAIELAGRHVPPFPADRPILLAQLHSRLLASDVKLALFSQYPPSHRVVLVHAAGTAEGRLMPVALEELDRTDSFDFQTTLFIPPLPRAASMEAFQEVIARLRAPDGCPWDREQTHLSLRRHLLEETYEVLEALDREDTAGLREELGDLLLQIVLHAQIALEGDEFRLSDVLGDLHEKIVRRHPHVFGAVKVSSVEEVLHRWEALKDAERPAGEPAEAFSGVSRQLPALSHAYEIQDRAARVGFDWPEVGGVLAKVSEEVSELRAAGGEVEREQELGDLLFSIVNLSRWLKLDPEAALRMANARFRERFATMTRLAAGMGRTLRDLAPEEWEALWQRAKGDAAEGRS